MACAHEPELQPLFAAMSGHVCGVVAADTAQASRGSRSRTRDFIAMGPR